MPYLIDNKDTESLKIAFGGAAISGEGRGYGFGDISESDALSLLHEAFDLGIRIYDTAPIYGFGVSEERIGLAFQKRREDIFIVSKCGVTWHDNQRVNMTNDPKTCQKMLEESLRRLNTDYIDLYMIHWPDPNVDIRFSLDVLQKAKDQKKILSIGLCNSNFEELKKAKEVCSIEWLQSEFNYLQTSQKDFFKNAKENNIRTMSWGSLDKGILTGRVDSRRSFDSSDCRSWAPWWKAQKKDWKYDVVNELQARLQKYDISLLEFCIYYLKTREFLDYAIVGAKSSEQLNSLIKAYCLNSMDSFEEHLDWIRFILNKQGKEE